MSVPSEIIQALNSTCGILLNKLEHSYSVLGLEPAIVLQGVSVLISMLLAMKVYSLNFFNLLRSKQSQRVAEKEQRKQDRLRAVVQAVMDAQSCAKMETASSEQEQKHAVPAFLRRV